MLKNDGSIIDIFDKFVVSLAFFILYFLHILYIDNGPFKRYVTQEGR